MIEVNEKVIQILEGGIARSPDNNGEHRVLLIVLTSLGRVMRQVQIEDGNAEAGQRIVWESVDLFELFP